MKSFVGLLFVFAAAPTSFGFCNPPSRGVLNGFKLFSSCSDKVPQISISFQKRKIIDFGIITAAAWGQLLIKPRRASAVDISLPECSDSITLLKAPGREIALIGTAHISQESAELVRRIIRTTKPNVVMIELDPKRLGRISTNVSLETMGFDVPVPMDDNTMKSGDEMLPTITKQERRNLFSELCSSFGRQLASLAQAASGVVLGTVISQFYKSIEKLGFNPGGEFKAAIEEGRCYSFLLSAWIFVLMRIIELQIIVFPMAIIILLVEISAMSYLAFEPNVTPSHPPSPLSVPLYNHFFSFIDLCRKGCRCSHIVGR